MTPRSFIAAVTAVSATCGGAASQAQDPSCPAAREQLVGALQQSVQPAGGPANGGLENNEWAAVVNRDGVVCAIGYSGDSVTDQWLGSRGIAVAKAATANAFGLEGFALSTANLYAGSQPGGMLYGLITTNPIEVGPLHAGPPEDWGTPQDPFIGKVPGGIVVFGGGLPLYDQQGRLVGALGVSGDTSCADHNVAWRIRQALQLDAVPAGVAPDGNDAIIYDLSASGKSESGYGHPTCGGSEPQIAMEIGAGFMPEWKQSEPK